MATEVISPQPPRRALRRLLPSRGNWLTYTLVVLVILAVAALGGMAYATYTFADGYDGRMLPGTTVAGMDVGGLTRDQAVQAVDTAIAPRLEEPVALTWKDKTWEVTPTAVDVSTDAATVIDEAMGASAATGFMDFARMRFTDAELGPVQDVELSYDPESVQSYVEDLARDFRRRPKDAALAYSTGWVEVEKSREGRRLRVGKTASALLGAFQTGDPEVPLAAKVVKPEITEKAFDQVLLLRIGENKLYLYEDGKIANEWLVATGQPQYPTPTGEYSIELKRYMPTWINPDPEGWGKSMPKMIPPGPGNPLGTRALNWTAAGIRFHGTSATYSLGHNASHGCVRMAMSDVEALYDMVDVGTRIVSIDVGGWDPLYDTSPDLASAEAN